MTETTKPDPSLFSVNQRDGEYELLFRIEGTVGLTINANSLEEAKEKARAMIDEDDFGFELDEVDDARVVKVYKTQPMYRITRNGKRMQTSRLQPGDEPREPDDQGF